MRETKGFTTILNKRIGTILFCATCFCGPLRYSGAQSASVLLPTGVHLDAVGRRIDVGNMPLAMAIAPGGRYAALLLSGWREQGLQIVDLKSGRVIQTLLQPGAFLGLAFSADGHSIYASGGNSDAIYCYSWSEGVAKFERTIVLAPHAAATESGTRYAAGLMPSQNGKLLYVAENVGDALAVVDLVSGTVLQRLPTERYPCGIALAEDGTVYVSSWGGHGISIFRAQQDGTLLSRGRLTVGRHPSALLLNSKGSRLFVALSGTDQIAVVNTRTRSVIEYLSDAAPAGPQEGSTPNALALSSDGTRLFVAEADSNAVALFDLSPSTSGIAGARGSDKIAGRIPTDWYPVGIDIRSGELLVLAGKGTGTGPNPEGPVPTRELVKDSPNYILGQIHGTIGVLSAGLNSADLAQYDRRVTQANGWNKPRPQRKYPPFKHVIYIIKENRTYDQVFGDLPAGDGDPRLTFFGREISPNHHALAERFGLFDRFFVNAEVSAQGHMWSTAAYVSEYDEKTTPSNYSGRRDSEFEAGEPANGFLWQLAVKKGITFRDYGEMAGEAKASGASVMKGLRPGLDPDVCPDYPGWDLKISDQKRADIWLAELQEFVRTGEMPQLEMIWLPGDHTSGAQAGMRTPRAYVADNDLALGRMVEALSHTPFWKDTVVFVVEDDAQNGPDHFDSHRAPFLIISAYSRPGTYHRFVNTTDVLASIEQLLGLEALSQFDYFSRPLNDVFSATPDLKPFVSLRSNIALDEMNPAEGEAARLSEHLHLDSADSSDDELFNRILWLAMKGPQQQAPEPTHRAALHLLRALE